RHTQRRCRSLYLFKLEDIGGVVRIPEKGYAQDGWNGLLENLQPLGTDVRAKDGIAGDISSRAGEAWHEPGAHGIADRDHDDGNRGGGRLRLCVWRWSAGATRRGRGGARSSPGGRYCNLRHARKLRGQAMFWPSRYPRSRNP